MLIDQVKIKIKAGNGGDGRVNFYHDRQRPKGGPDGGDGGDGGSVYFEAHSDVGLLAQFRYQKKLFAENGDQGGKNQKTGKNAPDLILKVPVGTVVNYDNGTSLELNKPAQLALAARGGRGGRGNYSYRSAINQTPKEFQPGQVTEVKNIHLQLKLIADVGLLGLPNAGKTSLLNCLTKANAKVADYAFTTLEPNLGVTPEEHYVLADIPGLISGASYGKGLGHRFLAHVERTKILIHCLSAESSDPKADYQTIVDELANYSLKLSQKPNLLLITKSDFLPSISDRQKFAFLKPDLFVSIHDPKSLLSLKKLIGKKLI
jgi:GTP-binding protein